MAEEGKMLRTAEGHFVGSGNPKGRPKGSKNKITLLKMSAEEAWRERNLHKLDMVLDMILQDALDGDKASRKMIFDAVVSKAQVAEEKGAGQKQVITVHRMDVNKGANVDVNQEEDKSDE